MLFLQTNNDELNKFIKRKIVMCTYNNSCITQMGIYHFATINKSIKY